MKDVLQIFHRTFDYVDDVVKGHGLEVAYIMWKLLSEKGIYKEEEIVDICTIAVMHDIGAYKTEKGNEFIGFELSETNEHSIYGYIFVKYFSPVSHLAEAVLYHHVDYKILKDIKSDYINEIKLINFINKVDIFFRIYGNFESDKLYYFSTDDFLQEYVDMVIDIDKKEDLVLKINSGEYYEEIMSFFEKKILDEKEIINYAKMLTYTIDFKSEDILYHIITVEILSGIIAKKLGVGKEEINVIKTAALLHDIGKITVPLEILEKPDKLTYEEMEIMKKHAEVTYNILSDIGLDKIRDIAALHHEKLDGSGYPFGLKGDKLPLAARIIAVADILGALLGKRSYKDSFQKETILGILNNMAISKVDSNIVNIVIRDYDEIIYFLDRTMNKRDSLYKEMNRENKYIQKVFFDKYK